jgi:hypothetical protein
LCFKNKRIKKTKNGGAALGLFPWSVFLKAPFFKEKKVFAYRGSFRLK